MSFIEETVDVLKVHGERLAGAVRIVRATPPEGLTPGLVAELHALLADSWQTADTALGQLTTLAAKRPRQTRVTEFVGNGYSEEADRGR